MKKTILMSAAAVALIAAMGSCSKSNADQQGVGETEVAVGEVLEMPAEGTDTGVIAEGEAIAVEQVSVDTNAAK